MRTGGIYSIIAILSVTSGMPAHAQGKLVMNDLAPWVKEDISIEPRLLTLKDVEPQLRDNKKFADKMTGTESEPSQHNIRTVKSALEKMYSDRVNEDVVQFGYDMFLSPRRNAFEEMKAGAVQDDFILGIGDEISVVMRGQKQETQTYTVTGEGMLVIYDLPPISAAGRSFGDVREQVKSEAAKLYNTDVFLSLARISQINVLVVGHVKNPGRQSLTSLDTILDALIAAGGIEKTGTLRQVSLIRNGKTIQIDLYGLLVFGSEATDISLKNGDKLVVRPVGPSIAVTGDVKRAGIYEILPALKANWDRPEEKSQKLSMNEILGMAGGLLSPAAHRFLRMDLTEDGMERIEEVKDSNMRIFSDGNILNIARGKETREDTIELVGNATQSGTHALSEKETLSSLLYDDSVVGRETYPLIGVIQRWNRRQMSKELIDFSPKQILSGEDDRKLENGDSVYLFSQSQIEALKNPDPQAEIIKAAIPDSNENPEPSKAVPQVIRRFLIERSIFIRGAVREPGAYPVADGVTLDNVLAIAGGLALEGDLKNIEITSDRKKNQRKTVDLSQTDSHGIYLSAGDTVRVNQKFRRIEDNHVLLVGEVGNPGTYDLKPGDTLGKLLSRAGSLSEDAYPDGVIFSRLSERRREESRFKSEAQDLELKLANMLQQQDPDKKPDPENVTIAKNLISQLKQAEALGRITVEADPAMLRSQPQLDILLETGDRIYIPKRPLTVRVAGEVLSPASLQFRTEKKPRDYINEAGGMSYNADEERAFVVYPGGSAQPLAVSAWNHNATFIPPGSTIIVPRDPKPLSFIDGAKDISQILANVATAAIFADDIRDDH